MFSNDTVASCPFGYEGCFEFCRCEDLGECLPMMQSLHALSDTKAASSVVAEKIFVTAVQFSKYLFAASFNFGS